MNSFTPVSLPPGFEASWAGPGPRDGDFCFGSEDGRWIIQTAEGVSYECRDPAGDIEEAINGVAFLENVTAVSTRAEVAFITGPSQGENKTIRSGDPHGAHGVLATASGYFVAPLGRSGLMMVKPETGSKQSVEIILGPKGGLNFYQAISLPTTSRKEILVSLPASAVLPR